MADEETTQDEEQTTGTSDKPKNEGFEQFKKDTLTQAQKHKNYIATQEALHNEEQ